MSFRSPQLHGYEDHIAIAEVIASTFPFAIDGLGLLNPMGMVYLPTWLGEFLYGKCRSIYRSSHGMVNDGWDDLVKLLRGYLFIDMLYSKPLMNQMNVRNYWSFYSWTKWSILCKKMTKHIPWRCLCILHTPTRLLLAWHTKMHMFRGWESMFDLLWIERLSMTLPIP